MKTYRVTVSCQEYYEVDVDANTPEEAEKIISEKLNKDYYDEFKDSLESYDDVWYVCEGETRELL